MVSTPPTPGMMRAETPSGNDPRETSKSGGLAETVVVDVDRVVDAMAGEEDVFEDGIRVKRNDALAPGHTDPENGETVHCCSAIGSNTCLRAAADKAGL